MRASRIGLAAFGVLVAGALLLKDSLAQSGDQKAPAGASALAPAGTTRVAVCDLVEVFNNYLRAKDLTAQRDDRLEKIKNEQRLRQKAIDGVKLRMEGLKKDSPQYEKELNEMQRQTIDLTNWIQFQETLILREHYRLTKEMYNDILKAVEKVARERGVQLVLDRQRQEVETDNTSDLLRQMERRRVLYCDETLDLTEVALSRLNEAYRLAKPATQP